MIKKNTENIFREKKRNEKKRNEKKEKLKLSKTIK